MKTVLRTAINPDTGERYQIEIPTSEAVRQAILEELEWPPEGMEPKDATEKLAEKWELSEDQKTAVNKAGFNLFRHSVVAPLFRELLEEGVLEQPEGDGKPYLLKTSPEFFPIEPIDQENYKKLRKKLTDELLQQIHEKSPDFLEKLVIDLFLEMGYGGSLADAKKAGKIGKSSAAGIDRVIKVNLLGIDLIYVQTKRLKENVVDTPEIDKFVEVLAAQHEQSGIFITTSKFSKDAQEYVNTIDPLVRLIDGELLAELMIDYNVGVSTTPHGIKQVDLDDFAN